MIQMSQNGRYKHLYLQIRIDRVNFLVWVLIERVHILNSSNLDICYSFIPTSLPISTALYYIQVNLEASLRCYEAFLTFTYLFISVLNIIFRHGKLLLNHRI